MASYIIQTITHTVIRGASRSEPDAWTIFQGVLPSAVAVYAVWIAARQAKIAEQKLRSDLFDQRLQLWKDVKEGSTEYINEFKKWLTGGMAGTNLPEEPAKLADAETQVRFLFGGTVAKQVVRIRHAVAAHANAFSRYQQSAANPMKNKVEWDATRAEWLNSWKQYTEALEELVNLMESRLTLADVGFHRAWLLPIGEALLRWRHKRQTEKV